jgi:alpha-galactosidase
MRDASRAGLDSRLMNASNMIVLRNGATLATLCLLALSLPFACELRGQSPAAAPARAVAVAPTPPMGWNSWDSYGLTITETQFRENVQVQAKKLLPFGYKYVVIDEGWFLKNPLDRPTPEKLQYQIDGYGRYEPVPARFPSAIANDGAATSFRALGQYVHSLGLRFGIHIVRGIPRISVAANLPIAASDFHAADAADQTDACPWDPTNWGVNDNAAGQAWYDSLLAQYASWGIDLLKVDCIATRPYKATEIRMIRRAIEKTGRPIVLSLSPGETALGDAAEVGQFAEMWRISNDVWDFWATHKEYPHGLGEQFGLAAAWVPYVQPGNWPDADMLPLGHLGPNPGEGAPRETRLTHDEQRTMLTLWSMMRSPLILGANLTQMDAWTLALITNRSVIEIDQHSHGGRQVEHTGDMIVWRAEKDARTSYLAVFNLGEKPMTVQRALKDFGFAEKSYGQRNLWEAGAVMQSDKVDAIVAPHGCLLLEVRQGAGK